MDMGTYDHTKYTFDDAIKDVYSKLPITGYSFIFGCFVCASAFHFIAEKTSARYGSIFLISYYEVGVIACKFNDGLFYKDIPVCDREKI